MAPRAPRRRHRAPRPDPQAQADAALAGGWADLAERLWDPEEAARLEGIALTYWDDLRVLGVYARDADGEATIGLRGDLADPGEHATRRAVLAHELGHHHLHAGIYLSPYHCRRKDLDASRVETQAERWGAERLLPPSLVQALGRQRRRLGDEEIDELAELARVPAAYAGW